MSRDDRTTSREAAVKAEGGAEVLLLVRMERRALKGAARADGRGAEGGPQRRGAWPRCRAAFVEVLGSS